jgi:hypothetical protein
MPLMQRITISRKLNAGFVWPSRVINSNPPPLGKNPSILQPITAIKHITYAANTHMDTGVSRILPGITRYHLETVDIGQTMMSMVVPGAWCIPWILVLPALHICRAHHIGEQTHIYPILTSILPLFLIHTDVKHIDILVCILCFTIIL